MSLVDGEECPICPEGKVHEKIITEEFNYKGRKLKVPNYKLFVCNICEEEFCDNDTIKRTEPELTAWRDKINKEEQKGN